MERTLTVLACVLGLGSGACSDDGLAPPEAADSANGSTGAASATSSVNTSATVTDTEGEGDDQDSVALDLPPPEGSTGTGASDSGFDGTEGDDSGTEGVDVPECVATEECSCDPLPIACESRPPECPPDMVPLVDEEAGCWDGRCVPIDSCLTVPECAWCEDDEACVNAVDLAGPHYTCQPIDPACPDGVPSCDCMPMACERPFFVCDSVDMGAPEDLLCVCPTC